MMYTKNKILVNEQNNDIDDIVCMKNNTYST